MQAVDLGSKAQEWFSQEGFAIESLRKPGYVSVFRVYQSTDPEGKVSVSQHDGEDKLLLTSGIKFNERDQSRINGLSEAERIKLRRDLAWLLHSKGLLFNLDERGGVLQGLTFSSVVFADGMTKDRLMTAIFNLYSNRALVMMRLSDSLLSSGEASTTTSRKVVSTGSIPTCPNCGNPIEMGTRFCGKCGSRLS